MSLKIVSITLHKNMLKPTRNLSSEAQSFNKYRIKTTLRLVTALTQVLVSQLQIPNISETVACVLHLRLHAHAETAQ